MVPSGKAWTQEEDHLLRQEVLAGTPLDVIAGILGRTKPAIKTRAYILRLMLGRRATNRSLASEAEG
jgi:hypothetical protein